VYEGRLVPPILVNKPTGAQLSPLTRTAGRFASYPSVAPISCSDIVSCQAAAEMHGKCEAASQSRVESDTETLPPYGYVNFNRRKDHASPSGGSVPGETRFFVTSRLRLTV
jgi:hypothetical protein